LALPWGRKYYHGIKATERRVTSKTSFFITENVCA